MLAPSGRIAFTTDSHVVRPLRFPGGDIGRLAVAGTVNDLATAAARPLALAAAFVIEEGYLVADLREVCASMAATAAEAGVHIVTGDTKVVERGACDGLYITTTGVGESWYRTTWARRPCARGRRHPQRRHRRPRRGGARRARGVPLPHAGGERLRPVWELVAAAAEAAGPGCASCATPPAAASPPCSPSWPRRRVLGVEIQEQAVPIAPGVRSACDLLGLDPLTLANEGKMVLVTAADAADAVVSAVRAAPYGAQARRIGFVTAAHAGRVALQTAFGTRRVLDMPVGELLPRIC